MWNLTADPDSLCIRDVIIINDIVTRSYLQDDWLHANRELHQHLPAPALGDQLKGNRGLIVDNFLDFGKL